MQPFSYYGGKQRLASKILPLIPPHAVYVEPFCGGATLFWNKKNPKVTNNNHYREVLNDANLDVVNFFECMRDNFDKLKHKIENTPYSHFEYKQAEKAYKNNYENVDKIERARLFYVNVQQGFSNALNNGWGYNVYGKNSALTFKNKSLNFNQFKDRLLDVFLENIDAIKCIKKWDSPQTFFYCDPPYPETYQGHYKGYTPEDFKKLVETLDHIQGSFLLSCYKNDIVPEHWEKFQFKTVCASSCKGKINIKNKSKKANREELGNRNRIEYVWRKVSDLNTWRPDLRKLVDTKKQLDLFDA